MDIKEELVVLEQEKQELSEKMKVKNGKVKVGCPHDFIYRGAEIA